MWGSGSGAPTLGDFYDFSILGIFGLFRHIWILDLAYLDLDLNSCNKTYTVL